MNVFANECLGVCYLRLTRDGWELNQALSNDSEQVFEKTWIRQVKLRKHCQRTKRGRPGGVYSDSHVLIDGDAEIVVGPMWEWADIVGRRLAWAEAGAISAANFDPDLIGAVEGAKKLYDFTATKFEALAAPY